MSAQKRVSGREMADTLDFWRRHKAALEKDGLVGENALQYLRAYLKRESIGYELWQIRPGKHGQWDVYFGAEGIGLSLTERLLISGLSAEEVAREERREKLLHKWCIDPDDPAQVREIEHLEAMSPSELDAEIELLKALLAEPAR